MINRAGQLPTNGDLINITETVKAFFDKVPDVNNPDEMVAFGTSGHRGSAQNTSFNEAHIVAITASIAEYRKAQGLGGPLFVGFDTHLLSAPAFRTCLEVLAATDIEYCIDNHVTAELIALASRGETPTGCAIWTPTPVISHAILCANHGKTNDIDLADGIVITPSHNPPSGGGIKYNPPHGGPADSDATGVIAARANEILADNWHDVPRVDFDMALEKAGRVDYRKNYIDDLNNVIDMQAISDAGVKVCADALGGSSADYWGEIAKAYNLSLSVLNNKIDPTFGFMTLDWDEKIRMDCSSANAMAGTLAQADSGNFDLLVGNDTDADRHGIIAKNPKTGNFELMNPNHYLAVAISYLFGDNRPDWKKSVGIGKTLVSSSLIDRVSAGLGAKLVEVPVGFKWFVDGLISGEIGFGGEESAGASFLRRDGSVWTTDKDGIILALLAAEIITKTGKNPVEIHHELTDKYGVSWYERIDAPATTDEKAKLSTLSPEQVTNDEMAGEKIVAKLTSAPGNGAKIGGLKVVTENAWFAARPSGTEDIYKIYAESFISHEHLKTVQSEAKEIVAKALK